MAILRCVEEVDGGVAAYRKQHPTLAEIPFNSTNKFQVSSFPQSPLNMNDGIKTKSTTSAMLCAKEHQIFSLEMNSTNFI